VLQCAARSQKQGPARPARRVASIGDVLCADSGPAPCDDPGRSEHARRPCFARHAGARVIVHCAGVTGGPQAVTGTLAALLRRTHASLRAARRAAPGERVPGGRGEPGHAVQPLGGQQLAGRAARHRHQLGIHRRAAERVRGAAHQPGELLLEPRRRRALVPGHQQHHARRRLGRARGLHRRAPLLRGLYGLVRQTGGAGPQPHWLSMAPRDCQRVTREPGACAHASPMGAVPQAPAYQRARSELTWAAARHTGFMLTSPTKGPHSAAAGAPHAPAPRA